MASTKKSASNALGDPTQSLQTFNLLDLQQFTQEKVYSTNASKDFHLFYVGRDDVHDILKFVLSRVSVSLFLNMFGFDDDELNAIIMAKAADPGVTMLITLDKSQSGGAHEKALLASDVGKNPSAFNTQIVTGAQSQHLADLAEQQKTSKFVIGQSATHQISHTKGFVADGKVAAEGSTNWSASGEGTFVVAGQAGGPGYKAQNNTQSIITDADTISRFTAELIREHIAAAAQSTDPSAPTKVASPAGQAKKK
ncbi:MAG: phospholipase D-like domain-containing protein [Candidatus Acidiferrales bacterium]